MNFKTLTLSDLRGGFIATRIRPKKQQLLGTLSVSQSGVALREELSPREQGQLERYAPTIDVLRLEGSPDQIFMRTAGKNWALCLVLFPDNYVGLVVEYLHGANRVIATVPAGTPNNGEEMIDCAKREAEEELGVKIKSIIPLSGALSLSPRRTPESYFEFFAVAEEHHGKVVRAELTVDDDEDLEVILVSLDDLFKWVTSVDYDGLSALRSIVLSAMLHLGKLSVS